MLKMVQITVFDRTNSQLKILHTFLFIKKVYTFNGAKNHMFLYYHKQRNNEVFTLGAYNWVKINHIDNYKKSTIKRGQEVK